MTYENISPAEAKSRMDAHPEVVIVDVRRPDEFVTGHIPGAINVPLADIPEQPEARDYDPDLALYGGSADGTLIPERIIARAAKLLRADGLMVMEHDITQGERLAAFARTCGFVDVTVHNDYTGRPRYLTAEKQPAQ